MDSDNSPLLFQSPRPTDENIPPATLRTSKQHLSIPGPSPPIDTLLPTLFVCLVSSGMCITGLSASITYFHTRGLVWSLFALSLLSFTHWINQRVIARACLESQMPSYSKLIRHYWGRNQGFTIQLAMLLHSLLIISFLQQLISSNIYKALHKADSPGYSAAFYYSAMANVPLVACVLQATFHRLRWFAMASLLIWLYLFVGVVTEGLSSEQLFSDTMIGLPESGAWMLVTVGVLAYFMSSFQIIPYLCTELSGQENVAKVINRGSLGATALVASVFVYYTFSQIREVDFVRHFGIAVIGSCATVINILPTREFIVQMMHGEARDKHRTRDRLVTLMVMTGTLILSLFYVEKFNWKVLVGAGTVMTSGLGIAFPAFLFFKVARGKEIKKKIIVLIWDITLAGIVFIAGIMMLIVTPCDSLSTSDCAMIG